MGFLLTVILCLALYYLYRLYREQQKTNARLDKVLSRQNRLYELLKPSSTTSITSSQPNTPSTSSFPRHTSAYSGRASSNVGIAGAYTPKYHDPVDPQDFVARGQVMAEKEACINAVKGVQEDMKALDEKHKRQREKLELRKKALEEDLPPDWYED